MIETPTPHLIPWLDGPLRPKAQVIYDAFPEWKKRSIFADNPGDTTMNADDFLKKLSVAGGEIVSTGSLTSAEIATAFNDGRMYVDQDHMWYVFLPACPELKPDPDQRIEAVYKLCHRYYEALKVSLGNIQSIKAASPGVKTYDEWEKSLASIVDSHPTHPIIPVDSPN